MTVSEVQWKGYAVHDTKTWDQFKVIDFKPKSIEDKDIDIKIEYCGVCGSDVHTITGGWGDPMLPLIPGHEVTGHVVRVGPNVTEFKVGDRVGVGAQIGCCYSCNRCKSGAENYCAKAIDTYNAKYPNGDIAQGGYSTAVRANEQFVFPIPKELELEQAAPMLCAGLTVYSPLKTHGAGPGKTVGIVGIGGLGHFALQFAKALGSEKVVAFSHSEEKKNDAMVMGATDFVNTGKKGFAEAWTDTVDLLICTVDISKHIPLSDLLSMLKIHGRCIIVAIPDDPLPQLTSFDLAGSGVLIGGSHIGSKKEAIEMLNLAAKKGVKSYIELLPMKDCGKAVKRLKENDVRYRFVLKADL